VITGYFPRHLECSRVVYVNDDKLRRVRYWLGQAEDAMDLANMALRRSDITLDGDWRQEFTSDADVMGDKLSKLREIIAAASNGA
jgi:hypothetical protein